MNITVKNQKPVHVDPLHVPDPTGDFDPIATLSQVLLEPISTPLSAHTPVEFLDDQGGEVSDQLPGLLASALEDTLDPQAEKAVRSVLGQCVLRYDQDTSLPVDEFFAAQAARRQNPPLPDPAPHLVYSASNAVIPAAKELLSGVGDADQFFVAVDFAYHPRTLGFWFATSQDYADFGTWLKSRVPALRTSGVDAAVITKLEQTADLPLKDLSEALLLRKDTAFENEENSFARLLPALLAEYAQAHADVCGLLPFSMAELLVPTSVVMVNVEAHARASAPRVAAHWRQIDKAIHAPVKVMSLNSITKLDALDVAAKQARVSAHRKQRRAEQAVKRAHVVFRKAAPKDVDIYTDLLRVLRRMKKVNQSQNVYRTTATSFARANRRDPLDFNRPGKVTRQSFLPDLHVYVDTSGSISEENYRDTMLMLIRLAKKLEVNLYFSSFSHVLSSETLLHTRGKSVGAVWRKLQAVPKVSGGTNYEQIWRHVQADPVRRRRLSLVVTDFEYRPPSTRCDHPGNIYYAPCSAMNWGRLVSAARDFCADMRHIDPTTPQRLLGMLR